MTKIAIDIRNACRSYSGKGTYTYELIKQFLSFTDLEIIFYTDKSTRPFPSNNKVKYIQFSVHPFFWHLKVIKSIIKNKISIYFSPVSYIVPALLPKQIQSILTVHDLIAIYNKNHHIKAKFIEKLFIRLAVKKTTKILCVSNATKQDLINFIPLSSSKIEIIQCGISEDFQNLKPSLTKIKINQKYNIPEDYILSVGTIEPRKNFLNLIQAFIDVLKHHPKLKLLIVGKKGWNFQEIFNFIKLNNLHEQIIFTDFVLDNELKSLYQNAKIFIFPSFYEGFGIPLLEAMSTGCPIITSSTSSMPEVVGDSAILINPNNYKEIANAINLLLNSANLRTTLIKKGYQRIKQFSWRNSAIILNKTIENICKNR